MNENLSERYELTKLRITEIRDEDIKESIFGDYFNKTAAFLCEMAETYEYIRSGRLREAALPELKEHNRRLYQDILPENYRRSYANPAYAAEKLGERYGQLLSFLYAELRSLIAFAYEQNFFAFVIRMELFVEVYSAFCCAFSEGKAAPDYEELRQIIYWFVSDYSEPETESRLEEQLCPAKGFALRIIMDSDLKDVRYLYYFGEYVTEDELRTAEHMNRMPEEKIKLMADTYTEGFRMGFETAGKDISKKETVNIRYALGFERMIRKAVENFEAIGMKSVIYRNSASIFQGKGVNKIGYYGASANKQYDFDHKDDKALYFDKQYMNRKLEVLKAAYEKLKKEAALFGGPAVLEIFGEEPFAPETKKEAIQLTDKQQKLSVDYMSAAGELQNEYIKGEERSFTIIAFPVPAIGDKYEEIFDEIVKINTLDYNLYRNIQQTIIDTLDMAEYVLIKGMGENKTDLLVMLHELHNPEKETNFENCVADVNIPVGEVFTSPRLAGTEGTLHVSRVFLGELEYRNLCITFEGGMIKDYSCSNFASEEENRKYIKDNVLFHHETLPLGEFAIGTNTVAYVAAKKYEIEDKLPILIAEKMGPHFAVGDTCYSHEEDIMTYNPDGKAIIARENEISAQRKTDRKKAYFNCHTDITIPYDELGGLSAVTADGRIIPIIKEGRFVLKGCEELNLPFQSDN